MYHRSCAAPSASVPDVSGSSRDRPRGRPKPLGEVLPGVLRDLGLDRASTALRLLEVWDAALGPEIAPHCRLDGVRHGVLYANVRDSAWMQRLQLEKPRILERLTRALGSPPAQELRFRVSPSEPPPRR